MKVEYIGKIYTPQTWDITNEGGIKRSDLVEYNGIYYQLISPVICGLTDRIKGVVRLTLEVTTDSYEQRTFVILGILANEEELE